MFIYLLQNSDGMFIMVEDFDFNCVWGLLYGIILGEQLEFVGKNYNVMFVGMNSFCDMFQYMCVCKIMFEFDIDVMWVFVMFECIMFMIIVYCSDEGIFLFNLGFVIIVGIVENCIFGVIIWFLNFSEYIFGSGQCMKWLFIFDILVFFNDIEWKNDSFQYIGNFWVVRWLMLKMFEVVLLLLLCVWLYVWLDMFDNDKLVDVQVGVKQMWEVQFDNGDQVLDVLYLYFM